MTNTNFKVPYVSFMKHAQKITKNVDKSRPVLHGVNHKEGTIIVTDSHRLYMATDAYEGATKLINPTTGAEIDGNYPDTSRLVPQPYDAKVSALLHAVDPLKVIKLIETAGKIGKASDLIVFDLTDGVLSLQTDDKTHVDVKFTMGTDIKGDNFKMTANVKYVAEAFTFLKEAGLNEVQFNFYSNTRPFTFTAGNLTVLILPVRIV
jgi:hypothetical protein